MKKMIRNKRAFTLVEIMCVIAIILILLSAVGTGIYDTYRKSKNSVVIIGSEHQEELQEVNLSFEGHSTASNEENKADAISTPASNSSESSEAKATPTNTSSAQVFNNATSSMPTGSSVVAHAAIDLGVNDKVELTPAEEQELIEDMTNALEDFRVIDRKNIDGQYMNRLYEDIKGKVTYNGSTSYQWVLGNDIVSLDGDKQNRCLYFAPGSRTTVYNEFEKALKAQGYTNFRIDYIIFENQIKKADSLQPKAGVYDGGTIKIVGFQIQTENDTVILTGENYNITQNAQGKYFIY